MRNRKSEKIKVLFFGLGSIGKRHANIIKDNFDFELYAYRTGQGQEKNDLKIQEFNTLKDAFSIKPDVAFITNPTFLHIQTCLECVKRDIDLFIEKPISHNLEDVDILEKEIKKRNLVAYVAYNLRFHPVIMGLKDIINKKEKPIYFRAICNSYLPNWRPKQDYTSSYRAKKDLGGSIILELSHEFDYINWLFGEIKQIDGYFDKISKLKIKDEDVFDGQITCDVVKGNLHLDYFSLNKERKIQIYYNDGYLEGDILENTIKEIKGNNKVKTIKCQGSMNDTYKKQLEYFFEQYYNKHQDMINNFSDALKTFKKIINFKKEYNKK